MLTVASVVDASLSVGFVGVFKSVPLQSIWEEKEERHITEELEDSKKQVLPKRALLKKVVPKRVLPKKWTKK